MSLKVERGRTLARTQALQILFQAEALDKPVEEVIDGDYLVTKGPLLDYARTLALGCYEQLDRIDDALHAVSENWSLYRMPSADRNLLRIAVYEMRFLSEDPVEDAVVINEAVEVAKAFGTDESARFVNGVLGRIARADTLPGLDEDEDADEAADDGADAKASADAAATEPVDAVDGPRPAAAQEANHV